MPMLFLQVANISIIQMTLEWKDTSAQTVFNLSNKNLTEDEIEDLEKG